MALENLTLHPDLFVNHLLASEPSEVAMQQLMVPSLSASVFVFPGFEKVGLQPWEEGGEGQVPGGRDEEVEQSQGRYHGHHPKE